MPKTPNAFSDSFLTWNETLPGAGKEDGKDEATASGRSEEEVKAYTVGYVACIPVHCNQ